MNISSSRLSRLRQNMSRPFGLLVVSVGFAVVSFLGPVIAGAISQPTPSSSVAKQQLQGQVETSTGAPRSGRNPAVQAQTSLKAAVATSHGGIGQRVDRPAANLVGSPRSVQPSDVLPDSKKTGISVSGCLIGYGTPGVQCVPGKAPNNQPITCNYIRTMFPKGVAITGSDTLRLSTGNSTACGV